MARRRHRPPRRTGRAVSWPMPVKVPRTKIFHIGVDINTMEGTVCDFVIPRFCEWCAFPEKGILWLDAIEKIGRATTIQESDFASVSFFVRGSNGARTSFCCELIRNWDIDFSCSLRHFILPGFPDMDPFPFDGRTTMDLVVDVRTKKCMLMFRKVPTTGYSGGKVSDQVVLKQEDCRLFIENAILCLGANRVNYRTFRLPRNLPRRITFESIVSAYTNEINACVGRRCNDSRGVVSVLFSGLGIGEGDDTRTLGEKN